MGCGASAGKSAYRGMGAAPTMAKQGQGFQMIPDQYKSFEEVTGALRKAGLESSQLIVGVDFTGSNQVTGERSFGGRCLHDTSQGQNPYMRAMSVIAKALADFDDDNLIPAYGFGDSRTQGKSVFSFMEGDKPCDGLDGVLERYKQIAGAVDLAGPTTFAPLIRQAIRLVRETGEYHILLIVADGQVTEVQETTDAIVEATNYPLSIIMVGVGDGPWEQMEVFDDELPQRRFDNFQFVPFESVWRKYPQEGRESAFAVHALQEVPDQYQAIKRLNLLGQNNKPHFSEPPLPVGPPSSVPRVRPDYLGA